MLAVAAGQLSLASNRPSSIYSLLDGLAMPAVLTASGLFSPLVVCSLLLGIIALVQTLALQPGVVNAQRWVSINVVGALGALIASHGLRGLLGISGEAIHTEDLISIGVKTMLTGATYGIFGAITSVGLTRLGRQQGGLLTP